ncbi:MAG: acetyl-CoA carboxylase biotin carboxyl carrier protein [Acidimicrobiaceae bacterium]|nr:acetyl-CoA carboxylase biotin carboxyl carrier protein [Acidimicrobiaceae bacterium]
MSKDDDGSQASDLFDKVSREAHELLKKAGGPVTRVSVESGDHKIVIEWDPAVAPAPMTGGVAMPSVDGAAGASGAADTSGMASVTAPLVGTFYRSPEPGAKAFVEVGDVVEPEQEVGIIEAMKIMNRIVSDVGGRVAEIIVTDGDMVEFGQKLMLLEPLDAE